MPAAEIPEKTGVSSGADSPIIIEEPDTTNNPDQAENRDVLMVNLDDDLYLSDIDDTKLAESAPNKTTTGSQREKGSEPAVDLFPNAPKKIKPTRAESTNVKPCSTADPGDFFVRKRTNRERHPSSSREKRSSEIRDKRPSKLHDKSHGKRQPKPHEKRSSEAHDNRPSKDTKNQALYHRERSEPRLKSAIVKAKERMQQRSQLKHTVEVVTPNRLPNHHQKRPPIQPSSTVTSGHALNSFAFHLKVTQLMQKRSS